MLCEIFQQMFKVFVGLIFSRLILCEELFVLFPFRVSFSKQELLIFYGSNTAKDRFERRTNEKLRSIHSSCLAKCQISIRSAVYGFGDNT